MTRPLAHDAAMTSDLWQRVQELLAAVIACSVEDRAHLLEAACAGDAALQREVETLLAAHDETGLIDRLAEAMAPATSWVRAETAGWEGRRVDRYQVLELLGAGGMGLVYSARDERLGRRVALKFLSPRLSVQAAAKQRFLAEARAAAALDHPNVCAIHEIGETEDGQLFIAMPLYQGDTLQARLQRGRLEFDEAIPIAIQVARGLEHAHERGIVHRDVKPSNVLVLTDGTAKVLDFGIARMGDVPASGNWGPLGTIAYMSPEHVRGSRIDRRADIWSLGVLLHEMLTGTRPFGGDDRQTVIDSILSSDPDLFAASYPDVPSGTDDILRKALAKLPAHRYASMALLATDLAMLAAARSGRHGGSRGEQTETPVARDPESLAPGERRRAAVLVTVVSDYSRLVEHLPAVDAHHLVAQIRDLAVDVVRRHGGLVNQAIGEETVCLFGVPIAHEDDELRAVRAALELHVRVGELVHGGSRPAVRIQSGIHAGSVVVQRLNFGPRRYAIVGSPAQIAARLAATARPDAVVLSPDCQRLVAAFVKTSPCDSMVLEPGAPAVSPFRVTGETGLETRLEASQRSGLTPYVGRQSELSLLQDHMERARAGSGCVIAVVGEPGAGKSRLLYEFRERVADANAVRVLHGRCRAYGDVTPYFPFIEVLCDALNVRTTKLAGPSELIVRLRAIDSSLEPFIPLYLHLLSVPSESHPLPRHLQGEHLQAALLDALAAVIGALANRASLAVLLEDWHWADTASRAALNRMSELVTTRTILFVVTARPDRNVVDEWPAQAPRIQLDPLDFTASAAIMRSVLHVDRVSAELARAVFERTAGNPFFVEQVCCALLEQGAVAPRDGEAIIEGGAARLSLPDTIQAVIRSRLDNLDPASREVLRVAAVAGRDFEHALLAETLEVHVDLEVALARLQASGLIQQVSAVPELVYRFRHVLTQEVSYEGLLAHQRRSLHGVVGRAMERQHADGIDEKAALLAHHFERGESWPEAVRYGTRAAERALALSQFADALAMLDRVLSWLERLADADASHDLRADLLLQQERACETLGLRGRQREIVGNLIAQLAPRGPSARLAEAYLRQGDLLTLLRCFNGADRALSTALRISREQGDAALERYALRSMGLLRWHEGRHSDALGIIEHALDIDRACQDDQAIALDVTNLGMILRSMGDHRGALARLEEALAMPALAEDPKKLVYVLHGLANVHRSLGDLDRALSYLRRADDTSRDLRLPIPRSFHLTSIAHIDLQQGRIEAALDTYRRAVDLSRLARHADGLAQSLRTLGDVLVGLGRHDEALPYLREAAHLFAQLEDRESEADMWSQVAAAMEPTAAMEAVETWRRVCALRKQLGDSPGELEALQGVARSIRCAGRPPDEVIAAFEAALTLAAALGDRHRELALRNSLGIFEWTRGGYQEALRHYDAALLLVRDRGDRVHEGLILNSLGVTLSRLNRPEEARTALEESVALNRTTGQRMLEAHALAALGTVSRAGRRPDRAAQYFDQSLALRRSLGDRVGEGWMHVRLAEALFEMGDARAAREAAAAATVAAELDDAALVDACAQVASSSKRDQE